MFRFNFYVRFKPAPLHSIVNEQDGYELMEILSGKTQ
jgi:hypothetical protein